jgi:glycyl-tRNA synthetase
MSTEVTMKKITSLAKRRGFVFPGSEIYGGFANTYDYGPLGVEMLKNITNTWWKNFVNDRSDMYGLDTSILMSPKVWEAAGHVESFTDALIDCKECKSRTRADHLIESKLPDEQVEGRSVDELEDLIKKNELKCPKCGNFDWTKPREFNLLFETNIGIVEENQSLAYLRGEIAQGMFVNFKNVLDTMRPKLPFGIAQSGKAFRNEITLGNFTFRTLEFNLSEFEYFFNPKTDKWEKHFEYWKKEMENWVVSIGADKKRISWRLHTDDERSHYSDHTEDLDFEFPFGSKELFGLAYRTDFDLKNHTEKSGTDMKYTDPETGEKFIPHVVEPTFGRDRILLALLVSAYTEDKDRTVLKLHPDIAPYKAAVFPLVKNKPDLVKKAREVFELLGKEFNVAWDERGNIGKRYLSQDEIGTPACITIDYDTLEDDTVTIRDRDTTKQERVKIENLIEKLK